jgi:hypothetical protein
MTWNDNWTGTGIGTTCNQYKSEGWCTKVGTKGPYWVENDIDHQDFSDFQEGYFMTSSFEKIYTI